VKISIVLLAALLAAILVIGPGEVTDQTPPLSTDNGARQSLRPQPPEPPSSEVTLGDQAPDFAYQTEDNRWQRLHDLLLQGAAVLVFGADPATLGAIERERDAMLRLGTVPVALLDMRSGIAWAMARRLGLHYPVIPDSRRVIAAQFNAVEAGSQRMLPSWFVVDRSGRVRALRRGALPKQGFSAVVATALGLPAADAGVPAQTRH